MPVNDPAKARRVNAVEPEPPSPAKPSIFSALGPGLITGASDDDPSGIATYSQMGAQFGFAMLWILAFSYPLMGAIQEVSARIGRVTGRGIAANMRGHFPKWLIYGIVLTMLIANIVNLGADIGAMGAAAILILPGSSKFYAVALGLISMLLIVFTPYSKYVFFLKWLTVALLTYVAVCIVVKIDWGSALIHTLVPRMQWSKEYVSGLVAVLGTTISPYLFFWQAEQEVEEEQRDPEQKPLKRAPNLAAYQIPRIRLDTYVGMGYSQLIAFFIMLSVAATLYTRGIHDIDSAERAAAALIPIAGKFASVLFAIGIIGTGLLAVPILAGSAAFGVGEALNWPIGLERQPMRAKSFYAVLTLAMLIGISLNFLHVNMIKTLIWSAILNGVCAGPIMIVMMMMARNKKIMGQFVISSRLNIVGWIATIVMLACAVGLFVF